MNQDRPTRGWKPPAAGVLAVSIVGALTVSGAVAASAASGSSPPKTVVYAFGIGPSADDLLPAPGTKAGVVSVGDESIINDQLTQTRAVKGGYPIIGYDSGTCVYTRVAPDGQGKGSPFNLVVEDCAATAVLPKGSITAQGVITSNGATPHPATLAVTGGTGHFGGARGTVKVTFGKSYETFTFTLQ